MQEDMEAVEKLWMEQIKERVHLDASFTADEVEHEAICCQEAMGSVPDTTAKRIRINTKSMRWWNVKIKESRKPVRGNMRSSQHLEEAARAKTDLQK